MVDHLGAAIHQRLALGRVAVPHAQGKAGRQQAAAHRQAHQADAGKGQGGQGIAHVHLRYGGKRHLSNRWPGDRLAMQPIPATTRGPRQKARKAARLPL
ncbi:hypothetical protein D3C81_1977020 [compost metagenome]